MWGELHQEKSIEIELAESVNSGQANRLFREFGATLSYDVYSFDLPQKEVEDWQSESLLYITLKNRNCEVDAQNDFDTIVASFPLATRPSSDQLKALNKVQEIAEKFNGKASYMGNEFVIGNVQTDWDMCNDFLLKEWGEEPGSKSLRIMIEENYT
tara:strand:- start:557 stop:1024 length:468 start_codon:yes stop_codon:yes gene_type:complete